MSGFQQASDIRSALRRTFPAVSVGLIRDYIGTSRKIVIVSLVERNIHDNAGESRLGSFLNDPQLANTVASRAGYMLIVMGDPTIVQKVKLR